MEVYENLIRQVEANDEALTEIFYVKFSYWLWTPTMFERLGEALLQKNTHVTTISILQVNGDYAGDNPLFFSYIEKSETLRTLFATRMSDHFCRNLMEALAKRKVGLDQFAPTVSLGSAESFSNYLRNGPPVEFSCFKFCDPAVFRQETVLLALQTARIQNVAIGAKECCPQFLMALKENSNLKRVAIGIDVKSLQQNQEELDGTLSLIRACRNATYKVCLEFSEVFSHGFNGWDPELWSVLAQEINHHDAANIQEIQFTDATFDTGFCTQLIPMLFAGTQRKLRLGDLVKINKDDGVMDSIVHSVSYLDLEADYYDNLATNAEYYDNVLPSAEDYDNLATSFLSLLANHPTTVVQSLSLMIYGSTIADTLVQNLPKLRSVKSIFIEIAKTKKWHDYDHVVAYKNKIVEALWKNRSLSERVDLKGHKCIGDADIAVLNRLVQRNKYLSDMMDPEHLFEVDMSLVPHLFHLSVETGLNEVFTALESANAAFLPTNH